MGELFFKMKPEARGMAVGDLVKAREQREKLKCKNMSWFLKNVDHEMNWESDKICIPGCDRKQLGKICCKGPAAFQRSTIDRTMPKTGAYLKGVPLEYKPVDLETILRHHAEEPSGSDSGHQPREDL